MAMATARQTAPSLPRSRLFPPLGVVQTCVDIGGERECSDAIGNELLLLVNGDACVNFRLQAPSEPRLLVELSLEDRANDRTLGVAGILDWIEYDQHGYANIERCFPKESEYLVHDSLELHLALRHATDFGPEVDSSELHSTIFVRDTDVRYTNQ
jgi:hypothetical protein